jgi:hypothetical protein
MTLPSYITPDGKLAFFWRIDAKTAQDIWTVELDGEYKPAAVLQSPFREIAAKISPDGMFLAYQFNESDEMKFMCAHSLGRAGKWQISTEGGRQPLWGAQRAGIVLPQRRQNDGRGHHVRPAVQGRNPTSPF